MSVFDAVLTEDELKAIGCPRGLECDELTICDFCGQLVCAEHTDDAVRCDGGPVGPAHHYDCSLECGHCQMVRAQDAIDDAAIEAWKERDWS